WLPAASTRCRTARCGRCRTSSNARGQALACVGSTARAKMTRMADVPTAALALGAVPGAVLARKYRVERIIGEGGMGIVVEARHLRLDERVAIKFLLTQQARLPDASARFVREARAAVKIKSEHVARVWDVGELDEITPFIVMEYLEGTDLSAVVEK